MPTDQPLTLLVAFGAGLASFLSPCVLPVVPATMSFVTGMTLEDVYEGASTTVRRRATVYSAFFVLGFATLFVLLGMGAAAAGGMVRRTLPVIQVVGGVAVALFGLHLLGAVRIGILNREMRLQTSRRPASATSSFIAGVAFGAGWTPCVGPVLATILLKASSAGTVVQGGVLLAAYAAGLGVPFFLAGVASAVFVAGAARFRGRVALVQRIVGACLLFLGLLLVSGEMTTLTGMLASFGQIINF